MSVTSPLRLRPLAIVLFGICAGAHAQVLPRRDNLETALHGRVEHDLRTDRDVVVLEPGGSALLPADGGALADVQVLQGAAPTLWSSDGGALLVRREPQALTSGHEVFDTAATGRRWLRLDAPRAAARAVVHVRTDGEHGGEDPWKAPLHPRATTVPRARAESVDHVARFEAGQALRFDARGERSLRLDVWRAQAPRLLPADATWLRVEADGQVVFDGRAPTPPLREQLAIAEGCAEVVDLAGRVRVDLPAGAREVVVRGEPGTWLKVLAPLPGTPDAALAIAADPGLERIVQRAGESLDAAFNRAVSRFPSAASDVFLARFSYFRDVAVRPRGGDVLETRRWRARFPDRTARPRPATNRPEGARATIDATTFHWLPPGAAWELDVPPAAGPALVRLSVAHGPPGQAPTRLLLGQHDGRMHDLELDPRIVQALARASSPADALLAVDPSGEPVVDASQAQLVIEDAREPLRLTNAGRTGAWISVERRVPAYRRLADAALSNASLRPERLRRALLQPGDSDTVDRVDDPSATRAITAARNLLNTRADAFDRDACAAAAGVHDLQQSLDTFRAAFPSDPVLARCAAVRAATAAPARPDAAAALRTWSASAGRADVLTGFFASTLRRPSQVDDARVWGQLAASLGEEGEFDAAALAARAAGADATERGDPDDAEGEALPATRSAGDVRLRTPRQSEVAYASTGRVPALWVFPEAGDYRLELRSFGPGTAPRWVELRSGGTTWRTALPAADDARTGLRDVAGGATPGAAVMVDFHVPYPGAMLEVAGAGAIARIDAPPRLQRDDAQAILRTHPFNVSALVADRCRTRETRARLMIGEPQAPATRVDPTGAIQPAVAAPLLPVSDGAIPDRPAVLALDALWRLDRGDAGAAAESAARALVLREQAPFAHAALFDMLDERIAWEHVDPVSSGGRVLRALADGYPSSPTAALRQRLAGATAEQAFVVRPGQAWVLEGLQPRQRVGLAFELRAALPGAEVEVELTGGERHVVRSDRAWRTDDVADASGAIRLHAGPALPGTYLALVVLDAHGAPLDPTHGVAYHRSPVRIRLDRASVLRVSEWSGDRSSVRTQWVAAAGDTTIVAKEIPGAALRISRLAVRSAPAPRDVPAAAPPDRSAAAKAVMPAAEPAAAPDYTPAAAQASSWPRDWPDSGGEDRTWGVFAARRQRIDNDDPDSDVERFAEVGWRARYRIGERALWGRAEVTLRRPDAGNTVLGVEHALEWRQDGGPWGATLRTSAWTQALDAPLARRADALEARAAVMHEMRRDDRWRDRWELGVTARQLSLHGLGRRATAGIDNDVYSRYRDANRRQVDAAYSLAWRARYDSELVATARAVARASDPGEVDNAGFALAWRWARHGWMASTGVDARRYLPGTGRDRAFDRRRIEADVSRLLLGSDDGWRVRLQVGRDLADNGTYGGLTFEWFDHDGRGLRDFAPSELFLRGVTEADIVDPLIPPAPAP